jgi:glycosyltransferase involved in cell wall biosynthesis
VARILQLSGDWKWTGPAEPMLGLARALRTRGHEVWLSCPAPPPGADRSLLSEARAAGLEPMPLLSRGRGLRWLRDRADVLRLRAFLAEHDVEVVHAWHTRDHTLALRAARARRRAGRTRVVRSWRKAEAIPDRPWNRWLFGPGTDGLVCVSPGTARRNAALRGGRALLGLFGAVDLDRFRPGSPDSAVRAGLGLAPADRVVGIVARVQAQRRFDLLLEAATRLFRADPRARLLVVGRGTRRAQVAEEPARRAGIADRVVFAGYRRADYLEVLRAIDVFTYLVPGSDGTCRALLEAAACGLPAVVTRRGALAEIVEDGRSGLVVEEDPAALAAGWRTLLDDPARRAALGRGARARAEACFDPQRQAAALEAFYARVLGRSGA